VSVKNAFLLIFTMICFGASLRAQVDITKYEHLFPPSTSIVDVAKYGSGEDGTNRTVLMVDKDDSVKVAWIVVNESSPAHVARTSEIGKAFWMSGSLDLRKKLPKNEIPVTAERITNAATGTVFHGVVTALLAKTHQLRAAGYKVYLFQENPHETVTIMAREYDRVQDIVLDDVNDDDLQEFAVEWTEDAGKIGGLDIWTISSSDQLSRLELPKPPEKYTVDFSTDFTRFEQRYLGPGNRTIQESVYVPGSGQPFTREILYKWDKASRRYKISRVQEIRESRKTLEDVNTIKHPPGS
jgi:hypothetical protein